MAQKMVINLEPSGAVNELPGANTYASKAVDARILLDIALPTEVAAA